MHIHIDIHTYYIHAHTTSIPTQSSIAHSCMHPKWIQFDMDVEYGMRCIGNLNAWDYKRISQELIFYSHVITHSHHAKNNINSQLPLPPSLLQLNIHIYTLYSTCLQSNYYTMLSHTHTHTHSLLYNETNQQRTDRIRKNKNIRKEKVIQKRNQIIQQEMADNLELTREQRKHLQKEKNRAAAQQSRDRQRKYLEDLQYQMQEMSKQLNQQLCRKCKASLTDHSTSEEEHREQSSNNQSTTGLLAVRVQNSSQINILNQQQQIEELPFYRDQSRSDMEWGNIGRYFCIFLVVLSVALLSNSVETTTGQFSPVRPVARILTQKRDICQQMPEQTRSKAGHAAPPLTLEQAKLQSWPFKNNTGEPIEECKNQFWEHYLKDIKNMSATQLANPYDWNLVTCASPNLVHISSVYEKSVNHIQDKWTFLITNPIVSQVLVGKSGGYHLDEVSYLDGVYQLIAEKVALKKVIGGSCVA